jgi:hypothetical protein
MTRQLLEGRSPDSNGPTPHIWPRIRTTELVALIRKTKLVVIDAQGYSGDRKTISNVFLIDWIGALKMSENEEAASFNRPNMLISNVETDVTRPVFVFCESSSCWLANPFLGPSTLDEFIMCAVTRSITQVMTTTWKISSLSLNA